LFLALFVDGDVPGERMFNFQSKQNKTPCLKKYITSQHNKNLQDDNIHTEGKLL